MRSAWTASNVSLMVQVQIFGAVGTVPNRVSFQANDCCEVTAHVRQLRHKRALGMGWVLQWHASTDTKFNHSMSSWLIQTSQPISM
eukprot:2430180-Pleurochrysis_carterae.AAC.1